MKGKKLFSFCTSSRKAELIHNISSHISDELQFDRLLPLIVERVRSALGVSYCAILIKEGGDLVIRAVTEYPEEIVGKRIELGRGISGRCAESRTEIMVADLSRCDHYIHLGNNVFRSELDVPIVFHDRLLGVINVQSTKKNDFSRRDIQLVKTLSNQIGVALHNSQVLMQLQLVQDIGLKLVSINRPGKLFTSIVDEVRQRLHYDTCAILEVQADQLEFKASSGDFPATLVGMKIPIGQGITGRCAREKRVVNVGDVRLDADYIPSGIQDIRSEIACPVISEDKILGVLTVESRVADAFGGDDIRLLSILSQQLAVGMSNARLYAEIEKMAVTDPLTGLYNYRYFHQRLGAEIARSQRYLHPLSVILIDLDDFKKINDRYGHLTGDRVLREAALAFRGNIRRYDEPLVLKGSELDIISRYGGEEFIIIQPDTPLEGALVCAERLRAILETSVARKAGLPFENNLPQQITGSFGVTAFEVGETMDSMIKRADMAMYRAKELGKNRVVGL